MNVAYGEGAGAKGHGLGIPYKRPTVWARIRKLFAVRLLTVPRLRWLVRRCGLIRQLLAGLPLRPSWLVALRR